MFERPQITKPKYSPINQWYNIAYILLDKIPLKLYSSKYGSVHSIKHRGIYTMALHTNVLVLHTAYHGYSWYCIIHKWILLQYSDTVWCAPLYTLIQDYNEEPHGIVILHGDLVSVSQDKKTRTRKVHLGLLLRGFSVWRSCSPIRCAKLAQLPGNKRFHFPNHTLQVYNILCVLPTMTRFRNWTTIKASWTINIASGYWSIPYTTL